MNKKEITTVYWAPVKFNPAKDSWNLLYSEPKSVLGELHKSNNRNGGMTSCPAVRDAAFNIFSFESAIDDLALFEPNHLERIAFTDTNREVILTNSKLSLEKLRKSSVENHVNIGYNMGWIFFAEESITARMTAPFFPATSPTPGAKLSIGQFDIGSWFRPFNLDYHIPISSRKFEVRAGDPLFYLELFTDKKVSLKRFEMSDKLMSFQHEMSDSPNRYGKNKSLFERYMLAHSSKMPQMILKEIKNNLVG